ncbi:hypothetical protein ACQUEP_14720 [Enterococcus casseliflavus]|uniref:hypothetical protein n=1 Tax=Enterococcus casseliflavus TaxID=37734 RepID=UPI003D0A607E
MIKKPSNQEYLEYDGGHCSGIWKELDEIWKCPSCKRTKREVMMWVKRKSLGGHNDGWSSPLTRHHDHSDLKRFKCTIICGLCNSADGNAKVKCGLPADFSFSPEEIGLFVTPVPNAKHSRIYFEKAKSIYDSIQNIKFSDQS